MSNIGPFVGESTVDFAALSKAGLFLLEGPTGSGKSTVLDSIVFALYGSLATSEASNSRMRADKAALGDESFVDLIFEVNRGIFRVRRNPSYQRPKKSGDGLTEHKAAVSVWRLSSPDDVAGTLLSSRSGEADAELAKAIGLSKAQFIQTVLLPQGEFAAFLRASPVERQALLQRLFGTELYTAMASELEQRRRDAQARRSAAQTHLDHASTAFVTAAELAEGVAESIRGATVTDLPELTSAIVSQIALARDQAKASQAQCAELAAVARRQLQWKQDQNAVVARFLELNTRKAALAEGHGAYVAQKRRHATLTAAKGLLGYRQTLDEAAEQFDALQAEVKIRELAIRDGGYAEWLESPVEAATLLEQQVRDLAPAVAAAKKQQELSIALEVIEAARGRTSALVHSLGNELQALPSARNECLAQIEESQAAGTSLALLDERRDIAKARLASATTAEKLQVRVDKLTNTVEGLRTLVHDANSNRSAVLRARIDGIASELASALVPNEPCPVCGSKAHPMPAEPGADHADQASVDAANVAVDIAVKQFETAARDLATNQNELSVLMAGSAGASASECEQALTSIEAEYAVASARAALLADLRVTLKQIELKTAEVTKEHTKVTKELAAADQQQSDARSELQSLAAQVTSARGEFPTVPARIEYLDAQISALRDLESSRVLLSTHVGVLDRHRTTWRQQLADSPIADEAEFLACIDQLAELPTLAREIEIYETEQAFVTQTLSDPEFADLGPDPQVADTTPLNATLAENEAALSIASQQLGQHQKRHEAATRERAALLAALESATAAIAETQDTIRIADVVNAASAENLLRMPLPTYVLISRFKEVLAAANDRLATMSDGRYTIEHTEDLQSHGRKSGLGIRILDRHTEKFRQAGDLSGGETFYTALALALGLADVVVQEAGGVELGTLFIDEGFGSLDTETLDSVLAEIAHLRAGGRAVGVVSHVDELKQRISERIEVRRSGAGTSTLTVIA